CERITKADVEHYRPKRGVDEDKSHGGYYWLCYEWTNLIPSCITCNREGAKHNSFPILGNRIYGPDLKADGSLNRLWQSAYTSPLLDEIPCLLHPEIDDPQNFFQFVIDPKGSGIRIVGIDKEGRGASTIDICKLNRQELRIDRQQIIEDFVASVHSSFVQLNKGQKTNAQFRDTIEDLFKALSDKSLRDSFSYTLLRRFIVKSKVNFDQIILPFLNPACGKIVSAAFTSVFP
ncbi:MAG: hypothetical protein ACI9Z3_001877, partial [Roseivirga sp.]